MTKKYAIITTVSQFRIRYVIEMEDGVDPKQYVIAQEAPEFTQHWLGETIVDTRVTSSEDEVVEQFISDAHEDGSEILARMGKDRILKNVFFPKK